MVLAAFLAALMCEHALVKNFGRPFCFYSPTLAVPLLLDTPSALPYTSSAKIRVPGEQWKINDVWSSPTI